jgi:hypothetical protein
MNMLFYLICARKRVFCGKLHANVCSFQIKKETLVND